LHLEKFEYISAAKPSHLGPSFNFACPGGSRAWKSRQIRAKHFSVVLMGNDRNCVSNSVGKFWVQNQVKRVPFLTLPTPLVMRPEKVVKIQPKHFSTVLTGNDKNCTTNCEYVSGAKHFKIFVLFSCVDPRVYQKILQNYVFFFSKRKLRYLRFKILTKFHRLLFLFYFC